MSNFTEIIDLPTQSVDYLVVNHSGSTILQLSPTEANISSTLNTSNINASEINVSGAVYSFAHISDIVSSNNTTSGATVNTDASNASQFNITSTQNFTLAVPSNAIADGQKLTYRIKNTGGASITATIHSSFQRFNSIPSSLPIAASETVYIGAIYNATDTRWDIVSYAAQS